MVVVVRFIVRFFVGLGLRLSKKKDEDLQLFHADVHEIGGKNLGQRRADLAVARQFFGLTKYE